MRIGFLCSEYFGYVKSGGSTVPSNLHGGFGAITRKKCEELARMGHEVHAYVPSYSFDGISGVAGSKEINGVRLHLYDVGTYSVMNPFWGEHPSRWALLKNALSPADLRGRLPSLERILESDGLDVYQSEEPGAYTLEAYRRSESQVVVFQDPWDETDEAQFDSHPLFGGSEATHSESPHRIRRVMRIVYARPYRDVATRLSKLIGNLPSRQVFAQAHFIAEKAKKIHHLSYAPAFLPNPVDVGETPPKKLERPSVLWLARWDQQKRPDIALETARATPEVDFYFAGYPTNIPHLVRAFENARKVYSKYTNIHIMGFVSDEEKERLLRGCWILLNTSSREGLPMTFLEAGANAMTIVSGVNPDDWASEFGRHVSDGNFVDAIREAARGEWHKSYGIKAFDHVRRVHETGMVMRKHLEIYRDVLSNN